MTRESKKREITNRQKSINPSTYKHIGGGNLTEFKDALFTVPTTMKKRVNNLRCSSAIAGLNRLKNNYDSDCKKKINEFISDYIREDVNMHDINKLMDKKYPLYKISKSEPTQLVVYKSNFLTSPII